MKNEECRSKYALLRDYDEIDLEGIEGGKKIEDKIEGEK